MVTAKLSQKFYERFGDDIVNELVTWFNDVDATYRADLRELNETNFARFDAKLEQRLAEFDAKLEQQLAELRTSVEIGRASCRARVEVSEAGVTWRMFAFWVPTALATIGTGAGVVSLLLRR